MNRREELRRLDRMASREGGGLVVLYGRRRIGKTRILLEWARRHDGLYSVADQSTPDIQLRYAAQAIDARFPGFAEVKYPDWASLLSRLTREAAADGWHGPVIFDEFPYLVLSSPELPSVFQRWVDHEAKDARLTVALAGSSQRMMQGLVLAGNAPLYGRAAELLEIPPLEPRFLCAALGLSKPVDVIQAFAAWGGVPRYWELASNLKGATTGRVEQLVLDPQGSLHREPDRLLIEEVPAAMEVRPVLDAVGAGAHRVSEIASRMGRPATSMSRPLDRLLEMRLIRREIPFGESERKSRRSLYKIDDPFFRLWFRVVAPNRGFLANSSRRARMQLLEKYWVNIVAGQWEDLCRKRLPFLSPKRGLGTLGPWETGMRWWRGSESEWDVVSRSLDSKLLLLGEAKWSERPFSRARLGAEVDRLLDKPLPAIPGGVDPEKSIHVLFVPDVAKDAPRRLRGVRIIGGRELLDLPRNADAQ